MKIFPRIETERLLLNEITAMDLPAITKYASNRNVSEFTQNIPFPYSEKDAIFWLNTANEGHKSGSHLIFAVREKGHNAFMGGIGLQIAPKHNRAEMGYWLAEEFWNQGYMTEATMAVITHGFKNLNLNRVTSSHLAKNPASGKVMLKNGMKKEGELKQHIFKNSEYHDLIVYGLNKKDSIKTADQNHAPQ